MKNNPLVSWKNILSVFIGSVIVTASEGIIGNRADALFTLVWSLVQTLILVNLLCWCIVAVILLINGAICTYLIRRNRVLEHSLASYDKMQRLGDSLLRKLASLTPPQCTEKEIERVITDLLEDATAEFSGHGHRAAILLPDATREYLNCWTHYGMPQESIDKMKFYIGPDRNRRPKEGGVAGEVFLTGELQVGHIQQTSGAWNCEDCHSYIKLSGKRTSPPYLSFVNIPIIGTDPSTPDSSATICLGVICFDSLNKDVFDSEESLIVLRTFARSVAAALLIFKHYQNLPLSQSNDKS